ncbi:MAG: hypothetical protein MJB12_01835, partial [Firmicutes bacterium]|nr:hypothetical protein [Bacillota bacterium]
MKNRLSNYLVGAGTFFSRFTTSPLAVVFAKRAFILLFVLLLAGHGRLSAQSCYISGINPGSYSCSAGGDFFVVMLSISDPDFCEPFFSGAPSWAEPVYIGSGILDIVVGANTGPKRAASVTIRVGTSTRTLTVTQAAGGVAPELSCSPATLRFP